MLKIEHLEKSFGSVQVLKDLNLEIPDGSVFGLVGINGAGKSTLLRTIAGVYEPDRGNVRFNGNNTFRDETVRKDIAFVADEAYFPIGSTIRSLKMLYESMYGFDEEAYQEYLKQFDLDEKMSVSNLSKGMKRRVSLLFALSIRPKLLLLDEAYDGLEPLARLRFRRILSSLVEEEGITVIISSHSLRELEDICDSFGILEDGKILRTGDLLEEKGNISKYQLAFAEEKTKEDFKDLEIMHYEQEGRVYRLVIRGGQDEVMETIRQMNPVLTDVLPVSFEEAIALQMSD